MPRLTTLVLGFITAILCGSLFAATDSQLAMQSLNRMPLSFTKNMGQWDERVLFRTNAGGATMWFTKEGVTYQFTRRIDRSGAVSAPGVSVRRTFLSDPGQAGTPILPGDRYERDSVEQLVLTAKFVGANPNPGVFAEGQLEYKCNYFLGNEPSKWHTDVPSYETITLKDIYPGIDLKYSGDGNGQAAYEFVVAPGADIAQIKVAYEGAEETSIDADGILILKTKWGDMVAAIKSPADGVLSGSANCAWSTSSSTTSSSDLSHEDVRQAQSRQALGTLAVELVYSTFLGGDGNENNMVGNPVGGIAVDGSGNAYVTGYTYSSNFPITPGAYDPTYNGGYEAFVAKFSPSGALIYSTYLGGSGDENNSGGGIAVDGSGNAYVTGRTSSSDFPTLNPYQTYQGTYGYHHAFVTKLSSIGNSLIYSTYLGGESYDYGSGIVVDGSGNAYVTGGTYSSNFPTLNPYQTYQGTWDVFVTKLSNSGSSLIYSTYLGGGWYDYGSGIVVDGSGNAYVTGGTYSSHFPTLNPYQTYQGPAGLCDAFVTKLSSTGNSLIYSTYLRGSGDDYGSDIAVDGNGNAYVTGFTDSPGFPTQNPSQTYQGGGDAFVTKLSNSGNALIYSTYLGGNGTENNYGGDIAVDGSGNAYVTGWTESTNFPTQNPFQPTNQGTNDAFVTKLSNSGASLIYSTYLGGGSNDYGYRITVDDSGYAYVTGSTESSNFPTQNPSQTYQGGGDAFVTKLRYGAAPPPVVFTDDFSVSPKPGWLNTQGSCSWNVTSGSWQTSATGQQVYCTKSVGDLTWRNYDYQVEIKGNSGVDKVVNFRLQDANHWYGINLRSGSGPGGAGEILLTKRSDSGLPALLTLAPFANTTGVWYTIKVSCVDELLKVYVNNNPVLTYTDSADVYYSGGIGVTCYTGAYGSCDIAFDNVLVTDPYPHFEFDSPVVGEYVGDQIAISGKLAYRDGAPYVPSSGQLTVEDPAQDILATCQVQPNGTFVYSAPTAGTQEGLHMYVFACSTSSGLVYQSYNVGLSEPILLKNQSSETSLDVLMSRTYRPDAGGLQRTFNLPTDFLSIRKSNTAVKVTENNIKKGFRAIFGGIKSAVATGWNRTFNSGNPIAEWAKTTLRKCPGSGPPKCFLASGVLTYRFLSLPWEIVVGQLDNGLNKLHELGYIDDCTYQGAKTGLLAGKVIPAIGASVFGDPQSLLDAPNLGAELRGIKEEIEDRWDNCVDRATTNPYPSLAATFSADGYDGVLMAYLPKIPRAVVVSTFSPVEIAVMDPLGRVVSKTTNEIPGSDFMDFDMDMDGDSEQVVIVPLDSLLGDVLVNVTPRPGADPNAIFSVVANYTYYQDPIIIADSLLISQVPVTPIVVPTFENLPPTAAALLTTADTTFTGFPCDLEWTSATDPNPGHIVSYRVVVARQANFSDSVAVEVGTATTYTFNGRLWQSKAVTDTARYYWKVYAHDDWNESTASVDSRSFKVLYQCGDASGDRIVDISDAVYLIAYIFSGGAAPVPLSAGDANCDSTVDISDVVYLISYIFSGGAAPCEGCK